MSLSKSDAAFEGSGHAFEWKMLAGSSPSAFGRATQQSEREDVAAFTAVLGVVMVLTLPLSVPLLRLPEASRRMATDEECRRESATRIS